MKYGEKCSECESGYMVIEVYDPDSALYNLKCDMCSNIIKNPAADPEPDPEINIIAFIKRMSFYEWIIIILTLALIGMMIIYYKDLAACNLYYQNIIKDNIYILK